MFIVVDLPEPDGAHHRDEIARRDVEVDALQRLERGRALAVALGDAAQRDERLAPSLICPAPAELRR